LLDERRVEMAVKIVHFPCIRDLDGFDFAAPSPRSIRARGRTRFTTSVSITTR
jgi:hypothetical protein